jgi:hypothetical protein
MAVIERVVSIKIKLADPLIPLMFNYLKVRGDRSVADPLIPCVRRLM